MTTPIAVLVAGPNGAGKTTFARQFIPLLHPGVAFLNADEIQLESLQLASATAAARAMKTASDSSASAPPAEADELALLLEAARRATWDAKHGPAHLRSGRFFITASLRAHASDKLASPQAPKELLSSNDPSPGRLTRR